MIFKNGEWLLYGFVGVIPIKQIRGHFPPFEPSRQGRFSGYFDHQFACVLPGE
jgi:hypothetical protein